MKPALDAEEWERMLQMPAPLAGLRLAKLLWHGAPVVEVEPTQRLHALAALALYGQPFGFTREDVTQLRFIAATDGWDGIREFASWLADRIESLLPPGKK